MTGFGRGELRNDLYECIVEIKTINHRYKDFYIRMPRQFNSIEDRIRKCVSQFITRGRIEIYIRFNFLGHEERDVELDMGLAKGYYGVLQELKGLIPSLQDDISISLISRFPDIIRVNEKEYNMDEIWALLEETLYSALKELDRTRNLEGQNIKKDLIFRCNKIEGMVDSIKLKAPEVETDYKKRLIEKIVEYTDSIDVDETRILTEVAIYAEKSNITEEIIRLYSHINQLRGSLDEDSVGRKLDFLLQEMNREVNTIGSKANSYSISTEVVAIKSELEKIREQIQNIE